MTSAEALSPKDHVYNSIRTMILNGDLAGDTWLRETDLSADLGVSRTPVREAFRRLATEGLVFHEWNRGVRVKQWGKNDLDEVFSIRSRLEPWGCGLAATAGTAPLDELETLAADMDEEAAKEPPDIDRITELNNRFHRLILDAAGNHRLSTMLASLVEVLLVWQTFSHYAPEVMRRNLAHHHEIIDALRARDPVWAESVMQAHVRSAWDSVRSQQA